ncbi:hypothetical protein [Streptomyces sp. NPDC056194]|uniref:hypothetical protein n=1 Tax=unclassified Streptomyces TaxID=2593676 RepID=UPI0035E2FA02
MPEAQVPTAPPAAAEDAATPGTAPAETTAPHPALLRLLTLAEESAGLEEFRPYLADADPAVRSAAVAALGETAPAGAGPVLAAACWTPHPRSGPPPRRCCASWSKYCSPKPSWAPR